MSFWTKVAANAAESLVILKRTRHIDDEDLSMPEWALLKDGYRAHAKSIWQQKALVSMMNAVVFQRRIVFMITKRAFRELCQNDANWDKALGMKDDNYKSLIAEAERSRLIKLAYETKSGRRVYELIDPTLLAVLRIDRNQQYSEAVDFADQDTEDGEFVEGTTKGTTKGTSEGTTKGTTKGTEVEGKVEIEEKIEVSSQTNPYSLNLEEEMKSYKFDLPENKTAAPTPLIPKIVARTMDEVYGSWLAALPDQVPFNARPDYLFTLFSDFHEAGFVAADITNSMKNKILHNFLKSAVKSKKLAVWTARVNEDYETQMAKAFYQPTEIRSAPVVEARHVQQQELDHEAADLAWVLRMRERERAKEAKQILEMAFQDDEDAPGSNSA